MPSDDTRVYRAKINLDDVADAFTALGVAFEAMSRTLNDASRQAKAAAEACREWNAAGMQKPEAPDA